MRKKQLEMLLQTVPVHPSPSPSLEQYDTPADIAADILFLAYSQGDIADKTVVDLGCGTGIFSIGAKSLGATRVMGVEIDPAAVTIAENKSSELGLEIKFFNFDVSEFTESCDTVIQNPPFGAQHKGADRKFLEKALEISNVTYSLHLSTTDEFIKKQIAKLDREIDVVSNYKFPIKHMFDFHQKEKIEYNINLYRIIKIA